MTDFAAVRGALHQAHVHLDAGDLRRARAALKGVDHPKAEALLADVELRLAAMPAAGSSTAVRLVLFSALLVVMAGVVLALTQLGRTSGDLYLEMLPTLAVIATADCTPDTVTAWWGAQNLALDTFITEASSASRTMPGTRLDAKLAALRQLRADFPEPPPCAAADFREAVRELRWAMDETLTALEGWSSGHLDGLTVTTDLQLAAASLHAARDAARQSATSS